MSSALKMRNSKHVTIFPDQLDEIADEAAASTDIVNVMMTKQVATAIDKLWQELKHSQITSRSGKMDVLEVLQITQDKHKTVVEQTELKIKRKLDEILTSGESGSLRASDASQNFLLQLIGKDSKDRYHIKLAFQFLRAMVKTGDWDDYIRATLGVTRSDNCKKADDEDRGNGILHEAAKTGCCAILERYIEERHVHMLNAKGETPLHLAAEFGRDEDVRILLAKGAVLERDNEGCTPLHSAAVSMNPNPHVASLLIKADKLRPIKQRLLNAVINQTNETALHCAAANRNVTTEFIAVLEDLDPLTRKSDGETAFHVAARSTNPHAFKAIITTFAPTKFGWDIDDVDGDGQASWSNTLTSNGSKNKSQFGKTIIEMDILDEDEDNCPDLLIDICARNGNDEAVAVLIENGADLKKGVLHTIIDESVKSPEKVESLKAVYRAIVENTVLWDHLERNTKCPPKGSADYNECLRTLMIELTTRPPARRNAAGAVEYAIENGAMDLLMEMLNTEGVYRFDCASASAAECTVRATNTKMTERQQKMTAFLRYDVTDFVSTTASKSDSRTEDVKPYVNSIVSHYDEWREKNVLKEQPFLKLTEPFIACVQRIYLVFGLLQLAYMIWFSVGEMDKTGNDGSGVDAGSNGTTASSTTIAGRKYREQSEAELAGLVVWPAIIFIVNVVQFTYTCGDLIRRTINYQRDQTSVKPHDPLGTSLLLAMTDKFPIFAFCIAVFVWHATRSNVPAAVAAVQPGSRLHLEAKSMVMLFGWMATFIFFSGFTKEFYVFSILLREIIVKDILMRFALFFIFTVVAFAFSMHVLRTISPEYDNGYSLDVTVFQVFVVSIGLGDQILNDASNAARGSNTLFKLVFAVYMCLTAIILLNVLIAMMNQRYEDAMKRAESEWRFQVVSFALLLHNPPFPRSLSCINRVCGLFRCCSNQRVVYDENTGRYYLFVRRKEGLEKLF